MFFNDIGNLKVDFFFKKLFCVFICLVFERFVKCKV